MSSAAPWYALRDLPPGEIARVEVIWHGQTFVAGRFRDKGRGQRWARVTHDGDRIEWLPPRHHRDGVWPPEPDCWRPADTRWTWPNGVVPSPLPLHHVPRLTHERTRFGAVEAAETADLAREMEGDREMARAQGGSVPDAVAAKGKKRTLWWLKEERVYSPPGAVTAREAESRLMRALASDDCNTRKAAQGLGLHQDTRLSEEQGRRLAEIEARYPDAYEPQFQPDPRDLRDYDTAMAWFAALGVAGRRRFGLEQTVLELAARVSGLSWSEIATVAGLKRQDARAVYADAVAAVHAIANGARTRGVVARAAALAAVQEANRAARRT